MASKVSSNDIRKTKSAPPTFQLNLIGSYVLAESAKAKLRVEVSRSEYDLHRLLGHANMLDKLELTIRDKEGRR